MYFQELRGGGMYMHFMLCILLQPSTAQPTKASTPLYLIAHQPVVTTPVVTTLFIVAHHISSQPHTHAGCRAPTRRGGLGGRQGCCTPQSCSHDHLVQRHAGEGCDAECACTTLLLT
jgi:hypothetical protein